MLDRDRLECRTRRALHRLVVAHLPVQPLASVSLLGQGSDHIAFLVDDDLVVRFPTDDTASDRRTQLDRDRTVLQVAAECTPIAVPVPVFSDEETGCMAYRLLPGHPASSLSSLRPRARAPFVDTIASTLGGVLTALHAVPLDRVRQVVPRDLRPPVEWIEEAADHLAIVRPLLSPSRRDAAEAFVRRPPPGRAFREIGVVFTHNDLGMEHVLVDPATGTVRGIIDWSDAAITDPAVDFARILRDLGWRAVDTALAAYGHDPVGGRAALRRRIGFYARVLQLEDWRYAATGG